jgi:hypothetical protein
VTEKAADDGQEEEILPRAFSRLVVALFLYHVFFGLVSSIVV